jgi:hypothetical protein
MVAKVAPVAEAGLFGGAEPSPAEASGDVVMVSRAELQAMIAAAVAAQPAPIGEFSGAKALFDQMALSISEMTHQTNRTHKPVDPKVLAARAAGQEKLDALLAKIALDRKEIEDATWETEAEKQAALKSVTPRYRLVSFVVLDDELINPVFKNPATKQSEPIAIYWAKEPNDAMAPLNPIAKEVHELFRESRGARSKFEKGAIRPIWTTENGLVIAGRAPQRRRVDVPGVVRDTIVGNATSDPGLDGHDVAYRNVLGTTHRPFESVSRPLASKFEDAR